tara:strand:+ start:62 stop:301 length:240 start_codon:yes stop_codon:yes gene_type:complete
MYSTGDLLYALKRIDLKWLRITPRRPELLVELGDVKRDSNGNPIRNKAFETKKVLLLGIYTPCNYDLNHLLYSLVCLRT